MDINFPSRTWALLTLLIIWSSIWKAVALWKSAKNNDKAWFVALFILNTMGILEIFYIFSFSKRESDKKPE